MASQLLNNSMRKSLSRLTQTETEYYRTATLRIGYETKLFTWFVIYLNMFLYPINFKVDSPIEEPFIYSLFQTLRILE